MTGTHGPPSWLFSYSTNQTTDAPSSNFFFATNIPPNPGNMANKGTQVALPSSPKGKKVQKPSAETLALVGDFLKEHSLAKAYGAFRKEVDKKGWSASDRSGQPSLQSIFSSWEAAKRDDDSSDEASSSEDETSDSDSDSGAEKKSQPKKHSKKPAKTSKKILAAPVKVAAKPTSLKRKAPVESSSPGTSENSSSDSETSSDSESDSDIEPPPPPKKQKTTKPAAQSDSETSSSGSDSDSDSDSDSVSTDHDLLCTSSEDNEEESSSESESDTSSNDSEAESQYAEIKVASEGRKGAATSPASSQSSATMANESPVLRFSGMKPPPSALPALPVMSPLRPLPPLPPCPSVPVSKDRASRNKPFTRIPQNIKVDPKFASNEYVPVNYSERAHQDLIVTKGKGFTKEKNKKKKGSFRGGHIDISHSGSIYFDD